MWLSNLEDVHASDSAIHCCKDSLRNNGKFTRGVCLRTLLSALLTTDTSQWEMVHSHSREPGSYLHLDGMISKAAINILGHVFWQT